MGLPATQGSTSANAAIPYATLLAESKGIKARHEQAKREKLERERHQRLQNIQEHQSDYWFRVDQAAQSKNAARYDEAVRILRDLREAARYFDQSDDFQQRFRKWLLPYLQLRRPGLMQRLKANDFPISNP